MKWQSSREMRWRSADYYPMSIVLLFKSFCINDCSWIILYAEYHVFLNELCAYHLLVTFLMFCICVLIFNKFVFLYVTPEIPSWVIPLQLFP